MEIKKEKNRFDRRYFIRNTAVVVAGLMIHPFNDVNASGLNKDGTNLSLNLPLEEPFPVMNSAGPKVYMN